MMEEKFSKEIKTKPWKHQHARLSIRKRMNQDHISQALMNKQNNIKPNKTTDLRTKELKCWYKKQRHRIY